MKTISTLFCTLVLFSNFSFAEEDISENKQKMLEKIEMRINDLNSLKTCVSAANDRPAIKECRKKHHMAAKKIKGKKSN